MPTRTSVAGCTPNRSLYSQGQTKTAAQRRQLIQIVGNYKFQVKSDSCLALGEQTNRPSFHFQYDGFQLWDLKGLHWCPITSDLSPNSVQKHEKIDSTLQGTKISHLGTRKINESHLQKCLFADKYINMYKLIKINTYIHTYINE